MALIPSTERKVDLTTLKSTPLGMAVQMEAKKRYGIKRNPDTFVFRLIIPRVTGPLLHIEAGKKGSPPSMNKIIENHAIANRNDNAESKTAIISL